MSAAPVSKKRKVRSGCSGIELSSAFLVLQKFRDSITTQTGPDNYSQDVDDVGLDVKVEEDALIQLDDLLHWMKSKLKSTAQALITSNVLDEMQISQGPSLALKADWKERVAAAKLAGTDQFMSSANMHRFLDMLHCLVAKASEASARMWVDAFLYRASAMMPPGKSMALNVEYTLSPVTVPTVSGTDTTLIGYMDYTVVVSTPDVAQKFVDDPRVTELVRYNDSVLGFFVVEAKAELIRLRECLPRVLAQLYASARKLKKAHIRGALTNGYEWLFIILTVNSDGRGASYRTPRSYSAAPQETVGDVVVPDTATDVIAGILANWIQHSCEDLGEDDWFEVKSN